ncbi:hypothetical protein pb186bvf_016458 [Paramecium bursaria]
MNLMDFQSKTKSQLIQKAFLNSVQKLRSNRFFSHTKILTTYNIEPFKQESQKILQRKRIDPKPIQITPKPKQIKIRSINRSRTVDADREKRFKTLMDQAYDHDFEVLKKILRSGRKNKKVSFYD